jgi:hypothetical protein
VTQKGDWLFHANNYLRFSKAGDWSITPAQRTRAEDMINGGNAYLDLFAGKFRWVHTPSFSAARNSPQVDDYP